MWVRVHNRYVSTTLIVALSALAWLVLWVWGQSPYSRFLSHHSLDTVRGSVALMFVFIAGWVLMTIAMMLPTSLPLITLFHALTRKRSDQLWLLVLLITGYLGVWTVLGLLVYAGDWGLHQAIEHNTWLHANAWLLGPFMLVVTGVYQFTPLKYRCLDKCRSPLSFVMEHWQGHQEQVQSFWLGVHHGIFCVGCCWALMLLMFAVGVGNIGWMLALGAAMAIEKNMPWGRRLSMPLGVLLLGWGLALAVAVGKHSSHVIG